MRPLEMLILKPKPSHFVRVGYACINLSIPTKLRTARLKNASAERVLELARHNLQETVKAARWNAEHGIGFLRMTSDMIPFGSHPTVAAPWREELKEDLAQAGEAIRAANQRVGTHPGQYSVLNSPRPEVVEATLLDLGYHADMLDLMGVDGTMVLHLGGAYGEREAARGRFLDNARRLPANVRRRLVIENDDVTWNAREVLRMSRATGFPVVYDVFHDRLLPSDDLSMLEGLAQALATWPEGRTPKIHYSDAAPPGNRRGTHGDAIDPVAFRGFLEATRHLPDFDVMVEAKLKDLAVLPLVPIVEEIRGAGRAAMAGYARARRTA